MGHIFSLIRSFIFNTTFLLLLVFLGILFLPMVLMPLRLEYRFMGLKVAAKISLWLLRCLNGLDYRVIGAENLPSTPYIIASKHQSMWETILFTALWEKPCLILKRELTWIPLFGTHVLRCNMIAIDRSKGLKSLKHMIQRAKYCSDTLGMTIIIFPEGTRYPVGATDIKYHPGIAALYKHLKIPVVPIALNSGKYWGRNSFLKHSGTITVQILPPIQPGLSPEAFMAQLHTAIETNAARLAL